MCVLVDVSKYLDILTLGSSKKMVHLPFWSGCGQILRLFFCLAHSGNLDITSITFCNRHLWSWWSSLRKYCIRSWIICRNVASGYNSTFCISEIVAPTPNSWDGRDQLKTKHEQYNTHSIVQRSPHFCFWLSSAAMPVFSSVFSHSFLGCGLHGSFSETLPCVFS